MYYWINRLTVIVIWISLTSRIYNTIFLYNMLIMLLLLLLNNVNIWIFLKYLIGEIY